VRASSQTAALVAAALLAAQLACGPAQAAPGETLDQVKARGTLRCGVSEGIAGFSIKDAAGRWSGMDVDFCRAVAAAALGDAAKVTFVPLRASARFPALRAGQIDLLARNTTWTLEREAGLGVQFAGVIFYDGQGFMVPAKSGVKTPAGLKGAAVCVEKGTTSAQRLAGYAAELGLDFKPLVIDSAAGAADAFFAGKCGALTGDASQLAAMRLRAPGGPQAMAILAERISKEPLGPVVRAGDDPWLTLVRWVLYGLVMAEEYGLTQANVRQRMADPALQRALGAGTEISRMLDVAPGWGMRTVLSAGNYGEMFERNLGRASPLKLERGLNNLWNKGGLMYAPPVR
jgi:general L-amino acid transport system substrate-binding protein